LIEPAVAPELIQNNEEILKMPAMMVRRIREKAGVRRVKREE